MKNIGQAFSGAFIVAYMVFLVTLTLGVYLWDVNFGHMASAVKHKDIGYTSESAADQLMKTRGEPADWNKSNVHSFGLVNDSRMIDKDKLLEFQLVMDDTQSNDLCSTPGVSNYKCRKYLLTGGYDVWFNITYLNGSTVEIENTSISGGLKPVDSKEVIHIQRSGILDGEIVHLNMEVWE